MKAVLIALVLFGLLFGAMVAASKDKEEERDQIARLVPPPPPPPTGVECEHRVLKGAYGDGGSVAPQITACLKRLPAAEQEAYCILLVEMFNEGGYIASGACPFEGSPFRREPFCSKLLLAASSFCADRSKAASTDEKPTPRKKKSGAAAKRRRRADRTEQDRIDDSSQ